MFFVVVVVVVVLFCFVLLQNGNLLTIPLFMKNAKEQFRTSIKSIWSEYSLRRDKSSKDKKVEDTVFASFCFESSILSFARKRLGVTSPELIDVDEDLSKCKIVFHLYFFGKELFHV